MSRLPDTTRLEMIRDEWLRALGLPAGSLPLDSQGRPTLPEPPWQDILAGDLELWQARCYGLYERLGMIDPAALGPEDAACLSVLLPHVRTTLQRLHTTSC
ncbi:MAG: hypothetical protein VKO64_03310 [Candidatus Sericytochromatia bacterium]|nr:hypothetical protein [Candidatus Sericytochromatia bacterium]